MILDEIINRPQKRVDKLPHTFPERMDSAIQALKEPSVLQDKRTR